MRVSHSSLETFKQCPYKYKLNKIDNLPEPKSEEAVFGTYLHYVLQWFFENDHRKITLKDLLSFYETHFNEIKFFDIKSNKERGLNNFYFDEGLMMLKNFYQNNNFNDITILGLESNFELTLEEENKKIHIVSGIIDRLSKINNVYEVVDYKTGKRLPTQKNVDQNNQLSIYAMATINKWPKINLEKLKLSLYFLRHGEQIYTKRTLDDLEATKHQILKTIKTIENEKIFPPKPTVLCNWCGYKNICPVFKNCQTKNTLPDEANIKQLINKYFLLHNKKRIIEKEIDQIKSQVDNFLVNKDLYKIESEGGSFEINDKEICFYEWKKVKDILKPLGKWNQLIRIDESEFKKIMREIPEDIREKIECCKKIKNKIKIVTTTNIKDTKIFKNGDLNKNLQSKIYDDFLDI